MTDKTLFSGIRGLSVEDRFWPKVDKRGPDECWNWVACCMPLGYGIFGENKVNLLAHRVSWGLANGPIPKDENGKTLCVLHKCDNTSCVNPSHLFIGTQSHNLSDMTEKGRRSYGENHGNSKLTEIEVRVIRSYVDAGITLKAMGDIFGVKTSCIWSLCNYRTWRNI